MQFSLRGARVPYLVLLASAGCGQGNTNALTPPRRMSDAEPVGADNRPADGGSTSSRTPLPDVQGTAPAVEATEGPQTRITPVSTRTPVVDVPLNPIPEPTRIPIPIPDIDADGSGRHYDFTLTASGDLKFGTGAFRVWLPSTRGKYRGVIVKQHGSGAASGVAFGAYDPQWQALARKWNFVLIVPAYDNRLWTDVATSGTDKALLKALETAATMSGHPELTTGLPWVLWGHSAGGRWVQTITRMYPERTIAFAHIKGGSETPFEDISEKALKIPSIAISGENDEAIRLTAIKDYFESNRANGASIATGMEKQQGHDCSNTRDIVIPFFDSVIDARLSVQGSGASETVSLKPFPDDRLWLGNTSSFQVAQAAAYAGDKTAAAVLPGADVAARWSAFFTGTFARGKAILSTPPKSLAPGGATAVNLGAGKGIQLSWNLRAHHLGGVSAIKVYKNQKLLTTLPVRLWNYHDAVESPGDVPLRYVDASGLPTDAYGISMVDRAQQESLQAPAQAGL